MSLSNCTLFVSDQKQYTLDNSSYEELGLASDNAFLAEAITNVKNPLAILNTHGHFDHVWSNNELQKRLNIPLYTPKGDVMLLENSTWMPGLPPSKPDIEVEGDQTFDIDGIEVKFHHFPGHCPGCSMIEIDNVMFSGDFLFKNSIGRVDFPYSDPDAMKESLKKFARMREDKTLYPGHGEATSVIAEQGHVEYWLGAI